MRRILFWCAVVVVLAAAIVLACTKYEVHLTQQQDIDIVPAVGPRQPDVEQQHLPEPQAKTGIEVPTTKPEPEIPTGSWLNETRKQETIVPVEVSQPESKVAPSASKAGSPRLALPDPDSDELHAVAALRDFDYLTSGTGKVKKK
jgi:hypothetical protein